MDQRLSIALTIDGELLENPVHIRGQSGGISYFYWPDRIMLLGFGMHVPEHTDGMGFGGIFAKFNGIPGTISIPEDGGLVVRLFGVPSTKEGTTKGTYTFESGPGTTLQIVRADETRATVRIDMHTLPIATDGHTRVFHIQGVVKTWKSAGKR